MINDRTSFLLRSEVPCLSTPLAFRDGGVVFDTCEIDLGAVTLESTLTVVASGSSEFPLRESMPSALTRPDLRSIDCVTSDQLVILVTAPM